MVEKKWSLVSFNAQSPGARHSRCFVARFSFAICNFLPGPILTVEHSGGVVVWVHGRTTRIVVVTHVFSSIFHVKTTKCSKVTHEVRHPSLFPSTSVTRQYTGTLETHHFTLPRPVWSTYFRRWFTERQPSSCKVTHEGSHLTLFPSTSVPRQFTGTL
jgi:hypothetical protein